MSIKEIVVILISIIVLAFVNTLTDLSKFYSSLIFFAIILLVYTTAKKLTAYYYEAEEETKIWTLHRYGFADSQVFKNPMPIGILLPFIISILSLGTIKWFAITESEVRPLESRVVKRHEYFSFSEMSDWHLGVISASGIFFTFILAILAYLFNYSDLARLSVYFAFYNMVPIGKLDGTKIFFGSPVLWIILALISLISLGYAWLLI